VGKKNEMKISRESRKMKKQKEQSNERRRYYSGIILSDLRILTFL
jgi:hypothetical protein